MGFAPASASTTAPGSSSRHERSSSSVGGAAPAWSSSGSAATVSSVSISACIAFSAAPEHPGVEVTLAGPQPKVEIRETTHREVKCRHVLARHAAVEDEAGVGSALVIGEADDRVSADFLLTVEGDADVDGQRALLGEQPGGLQREVGVALVVHGAAAVQVAVSKLGLERIRLPEVERGGGWTSKWP